MLIVNTSVVLDVVLNHDNNASNITLTSDDIISELAALVSITENQNIVNITAATKLIITIYRMLVSQCKHNATNTSVSSS